MVGRHFRWFRRVQTIHDAVRVQLDRRRAGRVARPVVDLDLERIDGVRRRGASAAHRAIEPSAKRLTCIP